MDKVRYHCHRAGAAQAEIACPKHSLPGCVAVPVSPLQGKVNTSLPLRWKFLAQAYLFFLIFLLARATTWRSGDQEPMPATEDPSELEDDGDPASWDTLHV